MVLFFGEIYKCLKREAVAATSYNLIYVCSSADEKKKAHPKG